MTLVVLTGTYFVWFPEQTTTIAQVVGVGRGADLIAYAWTVISLLLILMLHLRTARLKLEVTELARHIAMMEADADRLK